VKEILVVGLGGFVGSALRYLASGWAHGAAPLLVFPVGTLAVNAVGCFLIGLAGGLVDGRQMFGPEARLFLLIGVLGGFTTFSSFAHETLALTRDGELARAFANIVLQVVVGLALAWVGYQISRSAL
jgi:CrcB protein